MLILNFPLNDFSVYMDAARATNRGKNPYLMWFFDRYNYPPAATLLFLPLTLISTDTAEFAITGISLVSLWITIYLMSKILRIHLFSMAFLSIFVLVLRLFPVKLTIVLGQINLVILALIIGSFFAHREKKQKIAGFLLGVATVVKLTPAPLAFYFLWKRRPKEFLYWLCTICFLFLIGALAFGIPLTTYYFVNTLPGILKETGQEAIKTFYMNQSLTSLLARFHIVSTVNTSIRLFMSFCALAAILRFARKNETAEEEFRQFSLLVVLDMILLPPFVWQHHFVFVLPAWFILLHASMRRALTWTTGAAIGGYFLLSFYIQDPYLPQRLHPFLATHFLISAIFIGISTLLVRLDSKQPQVRHPSNRH